VFNRLTTISETQGTRKCTAKNCRVFNAKLESTYNNNSFLKVYNTHEIQVAIIQKFEEAFILKIKLYNEHV
jgi:hypothetical protein